MVMGGILSGLMQGMRARSDQKLAEEQARERKQDRDLQRKLLDIQLAGAKTKAQEQQVKSALLQALMSKMNLPGISQPMGNGASDQKIEGPPQNQTPFADSFGLQNNQGQGLIDKLAQGGPSAEPIAGQGGMSMQPPSPLSMAAPGAPQQTGGASNLLGQAILGQMLNLPFMDVAKMQETLRHNRVLESRMQPFEYVDAQGRKHRVMMPAYPTAGAGMGAPGQASGQSSIQSPGATTGQPMAGGMSTDMIVAPAPIESYTYEKDGKTYEAFRNEKTKKMIGEPTLIREMKGESSETASKIALAKTGITYLDQIKKSIFNPDGTPNRKLIASARLGIGPGRNVRSMFYDALDARQRAASGAAIGKEEEKRYFNMYFPNAALDDDATIHGKINRLDNFMTQYLDILDPSKKYRKKYNFYGDQSAPQTGGVKSTTKTTPGTSIPDEAKKALKEGQITTFRNGQQWTLLGGEAIRLD
jgi:hypothetical protein